MRIQYLFIIILLIQNLIIISSFNNKKKISKLNTIEKLSIIQEEDSEKEDTHREKEEEEEEEVAEEELDCFLIKIFKNKENKTIETSKHEIKKYFDTSHHQNYDQKIINFIKKSNSNYFNEIKTDAPTKTINSEYDNNEIYTPEKDYYITSIKNKNNNYENISTIHSSKNNESISSIILTTPNEKIHHEKNIFQRIIREKKNYNDDDYFINQIIEKEKETETEKILSKYDPCCFFKKKN